MNNYIKILLLSFLFALNIFANEKPKNIIILIGDGMGLNQIYSSVLSDNTSVFKDFKSVGLSITRSADKLITDSAAGATAISTGTRTYNGAIGVDTNKVPLKNIMEFANESGLKTGVVSTSSVTHATPASFVTHNENRKNYYEIAKGFVKSDIDLAIGGGKVFFTNNPEGNLINELHKKNYDVILNYDSLKTLKPTNRFYALLEEDGLNEAGKRNYSLGDLTEIALNFFKNNETGFVLMIEGSQIDWAGHDTNQVKVMMELKDFEKAVSAALDFAKKDKNTLVIVTADHETGGVSLNSGNTNGSNIKYCFTTTNHTANAIGIFSYGPGSEKFTGFMENYEIGKKLIELVYSNELSTIQ